jgi:hypothetical protein
VFIGWGGVVSGCRLKPVSGSLHTGLISKKTKTNQESNKNYTKQKQIQKNKSYCGGVLEQDQDARKLSANLYDIHHCCVYSVKLLMMDRGTVRNM